MVINYQNIAKMDTTIDIKNTIILISINIIMIIITPIIMVTLMIMGTVMVIRMDMNTVVMDNYMDMGIFMVTHMTKGTVMVTRMDMSTVMVILMAIPTITLKTTVLMKNINITITMISK